MKTLIPRKLILIKKKKKAHKWFQSYERMTCDVYDAMDEQPELFCPIAKLQNQNSLVTWQLAHIC